MDNHLITSYYAMDVRNHNTNPYLMFHEDDGDILNGYGAINDSDCDSMVLANGNHSNSKIDDDTKQWNQLQQQQQQISVIQSVINNQEDNQQQHQMEIIYSDNDEYQQQQQQQYHHQHQYQYQHQNQHHQQQHQQQQYQQIKDENHYYYLPPSFTKLEPEIATSNMSTTATSLSSSVKNESNLSSSTIDTTLTTISNYSNVDVKNEINSNSAIVIDTFWTMERERALTRALIGYSDVYGNVDDVIDEIANALQTFKKEVTFLSRKEIIVLVRKRIIERLQQNDIHAKKFVKFHKPPGIYNDIKLKEEEEEVEEQERKDKDFNFKLSFETLYNRPRLIGLNGCKLKEFYSNDIINALKTFVKPVADNHISYRETLRKIAVMIYKKDGGLMTKRCLSEYLRTQEFGTGPQKELYLEKYLPNYKSTATTATKTEILASSNVKSNTTCTDKDKNTNFSSSKSTLTCPSKTTNVSSATNKNINSDNSAKPSKTSFVSR